MSDQPNLLFIMPDQMRHDFLSCYGAPHISTPNIDRIAAEGIRYDRAYKLASGLRAGAMFAAHWSQRLAHPRADQRQLPAT